MSLYHLSLASAHTFLVSVWALWAAGRGRLTDEAEDRWLDWWSARILADAAMTLEVHGAEHMQPHQSYVIMSNHQSFYDIPVVYQALRRRIRMVAKKELFRIPVWAQAMRSAGFVELDRQHRDRAIASLGRAEAALHAGCSIWIAPEGTRSKTGALGPFKKGGFHLAINGRTPILPVTIVGTRAALPANGWRVRSGVHVRVMVSAPVDPAPWGHARRDELIAVVRAAIEQHLPAPDPG